MKNCLHNYHALGMLFIALFAGGCGLTGKDSAGVTVSVMITPTYNGLNTSSVDAVQASCTDGSVTQSEYFADHTATASFSASLINPSNFNDQMTVYIDGYTIDYANSADSPGAPPIQSDTRAQTFSFIVSSATASSYEAAETVAFVDLVRKDKYLSDITTGGYSSSTGYLNNYTATYTFAGHGENGVHFTATAQSDFQIGSFNECPSGSSPL